MQMNQISLDINKSGQIINEPVVLRVGDKDQTITVNLLKDGLPYTSFTTATFFANKPSGAIVANDPANISSGTITYTVPQALVNEFGKITNAYFLIGGKVSTESFVIAVLQGVNISDDLNDYIPGMSNLNVIYDKWKDKLQAITDELNGVDAPKEVKNVIDNELKNYTDQINELQRRITTTETQLDALEVPKIGGANLLTGTAKCEFPINGAGGTKTIQKYDDETNYIQYTSNTPMSLIGYWFTLIPEVGQVYTLSADVCGNGYIKGSIFHYEGAGASSLGRVDLTNNWQRISSTFSIDKINGNWAIFANNSTLLKTKNVKVEKGNVATDWTPAPEDKVNVADMRKPASDVAGIDEVSTLQTQVNNSAVGTNLLTNTGDLSANWIGKATVSTTTEYNGHPSMVFTPSSQLVRQQLNSGKLQNSTQYTASFWAKADNAGDKAHTELGGSVGATDFVLTTNWVRYNTVLTSRSDVNTNISHSWYFLGNSTKNIGNVYIAEPKFEIGTAATDWCPNPSEILTTSDYAKIKAAIVALGGALS